MAFNSLTWNQTSLELDRFTEETQELHEELENVTKLTCGQANFVPSDPGGFLGQSAPTIVKHLNQSLDSSNQQNTLDECINQLISLEMNKMKPHGYQDRPKEPIVDVDTKLQNFEMNRHASDLRLKDSRDHMKDMEKMLLLLEQVQETKRSGDQRMQKTEEEALTLKKKIKSLEKFLKDYHRQYSVPCQYNSTMGKTIGKVRLLNYVPAERNVIKESEVPHNENHQLPRWSFNQECVEVNEEERSIEKQLFLQKTLSCQEKRCRFLEEHVSCLHSKLLNAQEEILSQETKGTLKEKLLSSEYQQYGLQEEVKALRRQCMMTRDKLCRIEEEKACLQGLFDQSNQERQKSQELLAEKHMEQPLEQQESQQPMVSVGEARQQAAQYSSTSSNLHQENVLLRDQLNHCRQQNLHLKTELDHCQVILAALEHEKCKLQASEAEHVRHIKEDFLAKEQLNINLEKKGLQLLTLTEEHKELQLLYSCKIKESEGVVLQLQSHLKHVQTEMDRVKSMLRTLKQKDDHGFHVALNMQKEITTRRRQIDSLQSKIQLLEATKDKLCQEKFFHNLEHKHHCQELALLQREKIQLAKELEAVESRNKVLTKQISELEAVISQMSGSSAGCQESTQLQKQEFCHPKPEHILDLKQVRPSSSLGAQHEVNSKKRRPHTTLATSCVRRRRPALERVQSTAFTCDKTEVISGVQRRRKHHGSKSQHVKTNNLQHIIKCPEPTSSPQLLGRRSPVHTLLTSSPNN